MKREGSMTGSQVKAILEVLTVDAQIARLRQSLADSYSPLTIESINKVDLEAQRRTTVKSIQRLELRRKALIEASAQNAKRTWTEHGDFSAVLHTGVILNGKG